MMVAKNPVQSRKKTASKAPSEPASASSAPNAGYTVGSQVSHPMFGDGTVTAINGDKLTIEFEGNVIKQIIDHYVKLRKS